VSIDNPKISAEVRIHIQKLTSLFIDSSCIPFKVIEDNDFYVVSPKDIEISLNLLIVFCNFTVKKGKFYFAVNRYS